MKTVQCYNILYYKKTSLIRNPADMETCISAEPHTIDGKTVELSRATPRSVDNLRAFY